MDAVESYKEIETKLTNVKAKQIEMKDIQSETQQVQNAILETQKLSILPITHNYLLIRRAK